MELVCSQALRIFFWIWDVLGRDVNFPGFTTHREWTGVPVREVSECILVRSMGLLSAGSVGFPS